MARAGPRPGAGGKSIETRAALIGGATKALIEVGHAGASAREIAARAGCNQALVFYHFGSVNNLLLAALDDVSSRRLTAYRTLLDDAHSVSDLIDAAREIFRHDLDSGHVTVLVEMITAAQATPGLGAEVASRLAPWRDFAEAAVRQGLGQTPLALLVPAEQAAHAVVAGFLGLELLAHLDGDRSAALALFDRGRDVAAALELFAPHPTERRTTPRRRRS